MSISYHLLRGPICKCDCHKDGTPDALEFMACCHLVYEKYFSKGGVIDMDRYRIAAEKFQGKFKKRK